MLRKLSRRPGMLLGVMGLVIALSMACAPAAPSPTPSPPKPPVPAATPKAEAKPQPTAVAKPTGKPIRFGHLTALSGIGTPYGASDSVAIDMAVKEINESGGINGSPLEIVRYDSPWDPKVAVTRLREITEKDGVVGVWGPFASTEFEVTAPLANELKIPSFGNPVISGLAARNRPWTFQLNLESDLWVPPSVEAFRQKHPQAKKMVVTGDTKNRATEFDVKDIFPRVLKEKGFQVIAIVEFETTVTDFAAIATKIKDLNPEGVVVSALYAQAIGLAKEFKRLDYHPPMIVSALAIAGGLLLRSAPDFVEGAVMPFFSDFLSDDAGFKKFNATWQAGVKADSRIPDAQKPLFPSTEGVAYSAVLAIANVMRKAGITGDTPVEEARIKLRDGFQNIGEFPSVFGPIKVLPTGQTQWKPIVFTVEKGQPKILVR